VKGIERTLSKRSKRFYEKLGNPAYPVPGFYRLMLFRMARPSVKMLDDSFRDYTYHRDNGWFTSG
jgi:hypothetical protein